MPPAHAPTQITDAQVIVRIAVDRTPEIDVPGAALLVLLPRLRDEVHVSQQVVEHAGVQDRLALEVLAQLVPDDGAAVLLTIVEVKRDLGRIELDLPALPVRLDLRAVRAPGRGIAVNEPPQALRDRIEVALDEVLHASEHALDGERALANAAEQVVVAASEDSELLVGDKVRRHDKTPFLMSPVC